MSVAPTSRDPKRISVTLSDEEHHELVSLARRSRTSVSALGHLAVSQLLIAASQGALPLLPPSTLENATLVSVDGKTELHLMETYEPPGVVVAAADANQSVGSRIRTALGVEERA